MVDGRALLFRRSSSFKQALGGHQSLRRRSLSVGQSLGARIVLSALEVVNRGTNCVLVTSKSAQSHTRFKTCNGSINIPEYQQVLANKKL